MKVLVIEYKQWTVKDTYFCVQVGYPEDIVILMSQGTTGIKMVQTESPDLVVIDSSSNVDTVELVKKIREFSDVPLVVLSEGETDIQRAEGLEVGADDYIIKPISQIEFLARAGAILRRSQRARFKPGHLVSIGELTIDLTAQEVFLSGRRVKMTPIEYRLLSELVRNAGRALSYRSLLERVWGQEYVDACYSLKRYICRLRSKLEHDRSKPQMLLTERGVGYKFIKHF